MTLPQPFREIRLRDPHQNIFTALAIVQSHILASDSAIDRKVMFGGDDYTGQADLEIVVSLLVAIVGEMEQRDWTTKPAAAT